jgi:hypothetical protein
MAKEHLGKYRNTFDCLHKVGMSVMEVTRIPVLLLAFWALENDEHNTCSTGTTCCRSSRVKG